MLRPVAIQRNANYLAAAAAVLLGPPEAGSTAIEINKIKQRAAKSLILIPVPKACKRPKRRLIHLLQLSACGGLE
jgi:hypothetical protein